VSTSKCSSRACVHGESPSCNETNRSFRSCFKREKTRDHRETLRSRFRTHELGFGTKTKCWRARGERTRRGTFLPRFSPRRSCVRGVKGMSASRGAHAPRLETGATKRREPTKGRRKRARTRKKARGRVLSFTVHDAIASRFRDLARASPPFRPVSRSMFSRRVVASRARLSRARMRRALSCGDVPPRLSPLRTLFVRKPSCVARERLSIVRSRRDLLS